MSEKVVIISDSTSDLSPELIRQYQVKILPLCVSLGGTQYTDGVDINPDMIYEYYEKNKELPKTSAVNVADFTDFFAEHTKAREYYVEIDHPAAGKLMYPGLPFKQSEGSVTDNFGAPLLGQDNEAVYGELGYSKKDLVKLRESRVI